MPKSRNILPPKRWWTPQEEDLLRARYADTLTADLAQQLGCTTKRVLAKANAMGLRKSTELIAEIARQRAMQPGHGSRHTRIQPGQVPWNKGVKGSTGTHPNSRATQFQPGTRPHTWVPVGSYRLIEGTILERKVNDLPGPNSVRWKPVTRLVWEAAHGPVPDGCVVVFKPGRQTIELERITLDALECITRIELMQRNSFRARLPPEWQHLVHLRGVLTRTINRKTKESA